MAYGRMGEDKPKVEIEYRVSIKIEKLRILTSESGANSIVSVDELVKVKARDSRLDTAIDSAVGHLKIKHAGELDATA